MRLGENVDFDALQGHSLALLIVSQVFNKQSQPIVVAKATKSEFTLDLRVNLQKVQADRLLVQPLQRALTTYTVEADHANRRLIVKKRRKERGNAGNSK